MLDAGIEAARMRYQNVVEATAETRAWGLEWFLNYAMSQADGEDAGLARAKCNDLEKLLRKSEAMINVGLLSEFFESEDKIPTAVADPRNELSAALKQTLSVIDTFKKSNEPVPQSEFRKAAASHSEMAGQALNAFLRELNTYVATSESEETGRHATLISGALSEIGKINETINLIAVNASVEAARAGAAGRGFSVIASEIQSLSHKSADVFRELKRQLR